jgi:hypothetical protein
MLVVATSNARASRRRAKEASIPLAWAKMKTKTLCQRRKGPRGAPLKDFAFLAPPLGSGPIILASALQQSLLSEARRPPIREFARPLGP